MIRYVEIPKVSSMDLFCYTEQSHLFNLQETSKGAARLLLQRFRALMSALVTHLLCQRLKQTVCQSY